MRAPPCDDALRPRVQQRGPETLHLLPISQAPTKPGAPTKEAPALVDRARVLLPDGDLTRGERIRVAAIEGLRRIDLVGLKDAVPVEVEPHDHAPGPGGTRVGGFNPSLLDERPSPWGAVWARRPGLAHVSWRERHGGAVCTCQGALATGRGLEDAPAAIGAGGGRECGGGAVLTGDRSPV